VRRSQIVEVEAIKIGSISIQHLVGCVPQAGSDRIDTRTTLRPRSLVVRIAVTPQPAVRTGKANVVEGYRIIGDRQITLAQEILAGVQGYILAANVTPPSHLIHRLQHPGKPTAVSFRDDKAQAGMPLQYT